MPRRYLLDTDTCIYIIKHKPAEARQRFEQAAANEVAMSVVTWGELQFGALGRQSPQKARSALQELASVAQVEPLTVEAADHYGSIRQHLKRSGQPIGNNDLWIAAHARALGAVLVTNNSREFSRVPQLALENWLKVT